MRYINRIVIDNFQSHKHSEFIFKQGLNVIVGPSDSGKTAVIRALKWVLYNEPSGDFFIREGEKECSVLVEFNEGTVLQRYRSKSKNGYLLKRADSEEMRFEGIGSGVPQEIVEVTGISKIDLDSDSSSAINLGEQLEGPFLLSEKPSTRANAIGRLVGVDLLDDALRDVLRDLRNINLRKKEIEESVSKLDEELSAFDYLAELEERSKLAEQVLFDLNSSALLLINLEKLRNQLNSIKTDRSAQTEIVSKIGDTAAASLNVEIIENIIFKFGLLKKYDSSLSRLFKEKEELRKISVRLQDIEKSVSAEKLAEQILRRLSELTKYHGMISKNSKEQSILSSKLKMLAKFKQMEEDIKLYEISFKRYNKLFTISSTFNSIVEGLNRGEKYIGRLEAFIFMEQAVYDLGESRHHLVKLESAAKTLKALSEDRMSLSKELSKIELEYVNNLSKYSQLLFKIGKCPYCLSDINEATIDHLIKNHLGGI